MLELKQIVKDYPAGNVTVHALKGVDLRFRTSEFVSILGPSGCGKTTLLNIIGGLDQYTSGDLVIDGVSTKDYKDRDWDTYRNHSIGFVFQTYNLIPHQTVLSNVELALTLAGVSKSERRERAAKALERVGLGDQLNKRPNQMSGGQMQRVAIARALVNNPDIILADEPTGALDTETGLQVMELLKEVANDRLVVMVTHNPELAEQYSSRIIRIIDGVIVGDSAPLSEDEYQAEKAAEIAKQQEQACQEWSETDERLRVEDEGATESTADVAHSEQTATETGEKSAKKRKNKQKRSSMSFWTAFRLSLTNLFTKKGRTFLTSFAGSIGIIGIALILSVSQGMTRYINMVEEQTLASYPLAIESASMDLSSLVANFMANSSDGTTHGNDKVYNRSIIYNVADSIANTSQVTNDLKSFKKWLEQEVKDEKSKLYNAIAGLQYQYNLDLTVYTQNIDGKIIKSDVGLLLNDVIKKLLRNPQADMGGYYSSMASFSMNVWQEILPANDGGYVNKLLKDQYDLVKGAWPNAYDEIVLVLNENNEISDISLYALGLLGDEYVQKIADSFSPGASEYENQNYSWTYDEIMSREYVVILNSALYNKNSNGTWYNAVETDNDQANAIRLKELYDAVRVNDDEKVGLTLKVSGIIRPSEDATSTMLGGAIGYTQELTKHIVNAAEKSEIVQAQLNDRKNDVLTGNPFSGSSNADATVEKANAFRGYYGELNDEQKREVYLELAYIDYVEDTIETMLQMAGNDMNVFREMIASMSEDYGLGEKEAILNYLSTMSDDEVLDFIRELMSDEDAKASIIAGISYQLSLLSEEEQKEKIDGALEDKSDNRCALYYDKLHFSSATWSGNLSKFGWVDLSSPRVINIYASSFDAKDIIAEEIARYNSEVDEAQRITYTDFVALVMSAVTTIIDAITYVLIAFVSISLIVSSIMIGVITLISVQERTKEIGILRAIGASKRDVSSMFNAETVIIGFTAGLIGVVFTYILCIPINLILHALTGIGSLSAYLPPVAALILVAISVLLTLISGLIPSRSAAKKDPVVALRTE